jgi:hypothetical protein
LTQYLVVAEKEGRRAEDEVGAAGVDMGPARPRGAEHRRGRLGLPAAAAAGRGRRLDEQPVHRSGRHPPPGPLKDLTPSPTEKFLSRRSSDESP